MDACDWDGTESVNTYGPLRLGKYQQAVPPGESDRLKVPREPGNARGGMEPDCGCVVAGAKSLESGQVAYHLHQGFGGPGSNCTCRRKTGNCLCAAG